MNFIRKLQNLSEFRRKTIFWLLVIIISFGLLALWAKNFQQKIKSFETKRLKEEINLPSLEKELGGLPKIEMPKISEEELKQLEEAFKEEPK